MGEPVPTIVDWTPAPSPGATVGSGVLRGSLRARAVGAARDGDFFDAATTVFLAVHPGSLSPA